jgi:SAM-dependent methyltransferase
VVALTAARAGATVTGVDLTPELVTHARENASLARLDIDWHEGDAEALPFADGAFDAVVSQFGHMFAPRPEVAVREMLRVLRPGGRIAFSTWPPELYTGRLFALLGKYALTPPPPGVAPPPQWGDPNVVRERLGSAVRDLAFDRDTLWAPALTPQHARLFGERNLPPVTRLVQAFEKSDPAKLAQLRQEWDELISLYFEDNLLRQDYLLSRAVKC